MGRTPDYKAAFMASLGADPEFYAPFGDNALALVHASTRRGRCSSTTCSSTRRSIARSRSTRSRTSSSTSCKERDDGIVVSGAKMLATGSALTHATFVAQNSATQLEKGKAEDFALVFIAPLDTPGQKLICRRSYEATARIRRSTTRSPAASTRTTRSWSSTTRSSRGRTCSSTATSSGPTRFYRAVRLPQPLQPAGRHAPGRQARLHGRPLREGHRRPTAPTSSAACRSRSASCSAGAT